MKTKWNEELKRLKKGLDFERKEEIKKYETEIKTMSGYEREIKGRAIMDLKQRRIGQTINGQLLYIFKKMKNQNLSDLEIKVGDEVIISQGKPLDKRNSTATVYEINKTAITVACSDKLNSKHRLSTRLDLYLNDLAYKRMEKALDKAINQRNSRGTKILRGDLKNNEELKVELKTDSNLNQSQLNAVQKALGAKDYHIIQGPPGTGKTHTIINLIQELHKSKKRVLITAQSNAAVDNILRNLVKLKLPVMRIGNPIRINKDLIDQSIDSKMHKHINQENITKYYEQIVMLKQEQEQCIKPERKYTRGLNHVELLKLANEKKSVRGISATSILEMKPWLELQMEINEHFNEIKQYKLKIERELFLENTIILTTNITAGSELLENELFDVLIMDEAAEATIPASLIPIQLAKKYIFVGDFKQLSPIVLSEQSKVLGLDISLMESIYKLNSNFSSKLTIQYRMNREINDLTSEIFYKGQLNPAVEIENRYIENLGKKVEWLESNGQEQYKNKSIINIEEKEIVLELIETLQKKGVDANSIAIITPYKAQVKLIKKELENLKIEVDTVDAFQGREKDIVILSLVRNNENCNFGFLKDYRRLNVSISRAKSKLYIIGNKEHLVQDFIYKKLIDKIFCI